MNFEIRIDGVFGEDFQADDIIKQMQEADGAPIDMFVNSPGGLLKCADRLIESMELYNGTITGHIAPFAASAASYALTACSGGVIAYPSSVLMIHCCSVLISAPASGLREAADRLDEIDMEIANRYAAFSGRNILEVVEMMEAETWMDGGQEIKEQGFCTVFEESDDIAIPAVAQAREQFTAMAAAYAGKNSNTDKRVFTLQQWVRKNPDNAEIKRLVDKAIISGKTENDIMARLLVAERDGGGRLSAEDIAAAKAVNMPLSEYRKYMVKV